MDLKVFADIDEACEKQIEAIAALEPFADSKIRIMPDAHSGVNSVVGFSATIQDKVTPNIVGGDIGCGVLAVQFKKPKKGLDFTKLDKVIRSEVPNGTGQLHRSAVGEFGFDSLRCWDKLPNKHMFPKALGTLGSGNHFIAIDKSPDGDLWLVVHSGSRNLGTKVAEHYQAIAAARVGSGIPDGIAHSMAWLEGADMENYLHDMDVACSFASENRRAMADAVLKGCGLKAKDRIESVHNYIDVDGMMIRKGAISAKAGEPVVIPLNMAAGCAVGAGLGNDNWNFSAPHGAGRAMTRKEARESISMSDYKKSMEGTWSSCVAADTVDESPAAYKDPSGVLERAADSVNIGFVMAEVYNFKAPTKE